MTSTRGSAAAMIVVATLLVTPAATSTAEATSASSTSTSSPESSGTKVKVKAVRSASIKVPRRAPGPRHMGAVTVREKGNPKSAQLAYRLDPARPNPKAIPAPGTLAVVDASTGSKSARTGTVAATAEAAYLLSEYGPYRKSRAQGAALELALDTLLQSKAWGIKGKKAAKRLRSSRQRLVVRKYARVMLAEARTSAGPYTVTVSGERVNAGLPTTLSAVVTSAAGTPVKGLDVDFALAGAPAGAATTTAAGTATARATAPAAGAQQVTATVSGLPDTQIRVVSPTRPKKASRLALIGGASGPVQGAGTVLSVGTPTLELAPAQQQLAGGGATFSGAVRLDQVAPGGGPMTVTTTLYGPSTTAAGAAQACQSGQTPAGIVTGPLTAANGPNELPGGLAVPTEGYYAYRVETTGNEVNNPAQACGGATRAMRQPTIKITQEPGPIVCGGPAPCGRNVVVIFDIANLPLGYQGTLHVDHYVNTGVPGCVTPPEGTIGLRKADIAMGEGGNGRYTFTFSAFGGDSKVYETVASLSPHDWMLPTTSSCGAGRYNWSP